MAKAKAAQPQPSPPAETAGRVSVIHLQGPAEERDWLTMLNKQTRYPKATIVRMALADWAKAKGLPPCPVQGD